MPDKFAESLAKDLRDEIAAAFETAQALKEMGYHVSVTGYCEDTDEEGSTILFFNRPDVHIHITTSL